MASKFMDAPGMYVYSSPGALWNPSDPASSPDNDLWKSVSYDTQFRTVLMFKPGGGDWGPLRHINWKFTATASYHPGAPWTMTPIRAQ
jgi:hypothetical protein